jgi:4-carboxymuconolactone decarboxylase
MPFTETARKNHEELFPEHRSTLIRTDPELVEVFDNFAFDEVLQHGDVDTKTRLMAILASLITQQTLAEYKVMFGGALNIGVTPIEAKEILYHSVPYVGIAKAVEFINATNDALESRGVELPLKGQSTTPRKIGCRRGSRLRGPFSATGSTACTSNHPPYSKVFVRQLLWRLPHKNRPRS